MTSHAVLFVVVCATIGAMGCGVSKSRDEGTCKGMSVEDMVGVTSFFPPQTDVYEQDRVLWSPDRRFVLVTTQTGSLKSNTVVDRILVWNTRAVYRWIRGEVDRPGPALQVTSRSPEDFTGPDESPGNIRYVRWSESGDSVFYLAREDGGPAFELYRASLNGKVERLSKPDQDVRYYATRDGEVVYEAATVTPQERLLVSASEDAQAYFVGTGKTLLRILFPRSSVWGSTDKVRLWTVSHGNAVKAPLTRSSWMLREEGSRRVLSIDPTNTRVILDLPVRYVPVRWKEYGTASAPIWPYTGTVPVGDDDIWVPHEYVIFNLNSGRFGPAVEAPDGISRGFFREASGDPRSEGGVSWAPDGKAAVLWNTFIPMRSPPHVTDEGWGFERPCLAIMNTEMSEVKCAESLAKPLANGVLVNARWEKRPADRLLLAWKAGRREVEIGYCLRKNRVQWLVRCGEAREQMGPRPHGNRLVVGLRVVQDLNSPPELAATLSGPATSAVLYDPNSRLRTQCIGTAKTVHLKIRSGKHVDTVAAGLLLPVNYIPGHRYPMVIQTHGYGTHRFLSSGGMVPFAARTLAASGIGVMQLPLPRCYHSPSARELVTYAAQLPCAIALFQAAIQYGKDHGLLDPTRIGIIGFSATCEQVLAALETSGLHFAAAEVVNGLLNTYTQFVDAVDIGQGWDDAYMMPRTGVSPFTPEGLQAWISETPAFGIYKIRAPVLIEANGRSDALFMWEPYAILHYLGRPVDLVVIHDGTHPFSNPREQLAAQGLGVDWFRFWLLHKPPRLKSEFRRWVRLRGRSGGHD